MGRLVQEDSFKRLCIISLADAICLVKLNECGALTDRQTKGTPAPSITLRMTAGKAKDRDARASSASFRINSLVRTVREEDELAHEKHNRSVHSELRFQCQPFTRNT